MLVIEQNETYGGVSDIRATGNLIDDRRDRECDGITPHRTRRTTRITNAEHVGTRTPDAFSGGRACDR